MTERHVPAVAGTGPVAEPSLATARTETAEPRWSGQGDGPLPAIELSGVVKEFRARGVEFTQEPVERYGSVDASFRDPSGNGWKLIQAR